MAHTPGPWIAIAGTHVLPHMVQAGDFVICVQFPADAIGEPMRGTPETEANARLIAAAPDLLAALKAVVDVLRKEAPGTPLNHHQYDAIGIQANNAIAKAEGR